MARFDPEFLSAVLDLTARLMPVTQDVLVRHLRARWPGYPISVCSADDVSPRVPVVAESACAAIYFVARGGHCLSLTSDAEQASGIVVALNDETG